MQNYHEKNDEEYFLEIDEDTEKLHKCHKEANGKNDTKHEHWKSRKSFS